MALRAASFAPVYCGKRLQLASKIIRTNICPHAKKVFIHCGALRSRRADYLPTRCWFAPAARAQGDGEGIMIAGEG